MTSSFTSSMTAALTAAMVAGEDSSVPSAAILTEDLGFYLVTEDGNPIVQEG